jgi:hypothetical protein
MGILSSDTSIEAERIQIGILRNLGPVARLEQLAEATTMNWTLVCATTPIAQSFNRWLGRPHPALPEGELAPMKPIATPLLAATRLETLQIPYVVGGSYASSIHGEPRSTRDCDFVVQMGSEDVDRLMEAFQNDFYVSRPAIEEAIRKKRSFNLIDLASGFKLDMFVSEDREYDRERMQRGLNLEVHGTPIRISTAEDTILAKLEWYTGSPTSQQWRDVLGILLIQGEKLDKNYMDLWARQLNVTDLLEKALQAVRG